MVIVRIAKISIPNVKERDHTDGVRDPETAIRAGNSRADCVAVGDIPTFLMRFYPRTSFIWTATHHMPDSS